MGGDIGEHPPPSVASHTFVGEHRGQKARRRQIRCKGFLGRLKGLGRLVGSTAKTLCTNRDGGPLGYLQQVRGYGDTWVTDRLPEHRAAAATFEIYYYRRSCCCLLN